MKRNDDGFTVVELLVAVVILGIVIGAVTAAIIVGLRTTDGTQQRLAESHNAQMASSFFVQDVESADMVSVPGTQCTGTGTTPVVSFSWSEHASATGAGVPKVASYVVEQDAPGPGAEKRLVRRFCSGTPLADAGEVTIGHFPLSVVAPTVVCAPMPSCSGPVKTVTMTVSEASTYEYSVTGTRRTP